MILPENVMQGDDKLTINPWTLMSDKKQKKNKTKQKTKNKKKKKKVTKTTTT